jgi:hypothetical protein
MKLRKVVGRLLLSAVLLYVAWMGWQILRFKRYESTLLPASKTTTTGSPKVNTASPGVVSRGNPKVDIASSGAPAVYEIEGAYHMHSRFSDGRKTVDEIAQIAAEAKLDFIIFTDHGKPNFKSLDAQGRKDGVLVLAGSELSVSRGHLVALDFARPESGRVFSQNAENAVGEVRALGGFTIIAHPYSKIRWSWGELVEYAGLELLNGDSLIKQNVLAHLAYYPALLVKPTFALLKMIEPPAAELGKWDQLLARRPGQPMLGFYSVDAHFMYAAAFPLFHLHVLLDAPPAADFETARRQIFAALREGRFYSAIDGAAAARGFRIRREGPALRVSAPFSFAHETVIIHDGRVMHRTRENEFAVALAGPGVYRAEVFLRERTPLDGGVPWIAANPIAIGKDDR